MWVCLSRPCCLSQTPSGHAERLHGIGRLRPRALCDAGPNTDRQTGWQDGLSQMPLRHRAGCLVGSGPSKPVAPAWECPHRAEDMLLEPSGVGWACSHSPIRLSEICASQPATQGDARRGDEGLTATAAARSARGRRAPRRRRDRTGDGKDPDGHEGCDGHRTEYLWPWGVRWASLGDTMPRVTLMDTHSDRSFIRAQ